MYSSYLLILLGECGISERGDQGGDIVTLPPQKGKSRAVYTPSHNEPFEDFAGAFQ